MSKDEKKQALDAALSQIEKAFGKEAIMKLGEKSAKTAVSVIPTGALSLDLALGVGGLPRGRVIEIFGPEASGKGVQTPGPRIQSRRASRLPTHPATILTWRRSSRSDTHQSLYC